MVCLGSIEFSVEYIRLWNLLSRCRLCRNHRKLSRAGWRKQVFVRNGRIIIRKQRTGDALPCIYQCNRITADDIEYYDLLRFEELKEFEPLEIDFSEENARMNTCVETDENGRWIKIELTSLV
ncbi:hypothetical protein DRP05_00850 [Archaeoglobales archaeon]|nr:MAG: hypothetical protein DRP05_00850 [Archaeoglobales archaeon]